jgi:transcription elongation GreA/GreB family factor
VRTDVASAGTIVHATDLATSQAEQFTILGAWDSDPEKNLVSYLSPVAQALIGHKVGDEVEFEVHGVVHRHRLDSILPYKTAQTADAGAQAQPADGGSQALPPKLT